MKFQSARKIRCRLAGASLLCFMTDPNFSAIYFLLGKERYWCHQKRLWCDFGGSVNAGDRDAEDTAAREFYEETLAIVSFFNGDSLPRPHWTDIADSLRQGHYILKITQTDGTRKFVSFVKEIPWDPGVISRFSLLRKKLTSPCSSLCHPNHPNHPSQDEQGNVRTEYLEKKVLGMWSLPQIQFAARNKGYITTRNGYEERCRVSFTNTLEIVLKELKIINYLNKWRH